MRIYNRHLNSTLRRFSIQPLLQKCYIDNLDLTTKMLRLSTSLGSDVAGQLEIVH